MLNRRLLGLVGCARRRLLNVVLLGLAVTATYVAQGLVIAYALAKIFDGHPFSDIVGLLAGALLLIGVRALLIWVREQAAAEVAAIVKLRLRERLYAHLLALGPGYLLRTRTGVVLTTLVNGVETLDRYAAVYVPQLLVSLVGTIAIVGIIVAIDPVVGAVVLGCGAAAVFAPRISEGMLSESSRAYWRQWRLLGSAYLDAVQGMSTLKALGASAAQGAMLRARSWDFYRASLRLTAVSNVSIGAMGLAESGGLALAIGVGALRFEAGVLTITELLVLLMLNREAFRPLRDLQSAFHATYSAEAAAGGIFELLESESAVTDPGSGERRASPLGDAAPAVSFDGVSFAYDAAGRPALRDFSLAVAPRETVAIVGRSGAGKTTVVSLLLRFFDPQSGRIRIDGVDVRAIALARLRAMVAVVSQDIYLFHGTIYDNVAFGRPGASDAEVRQALQLANAAEFVDALPAGAETVVGDRGLTLSGGQRQRLAIARALIKDAPILVLDEATSSVDVRGERIVQEALERAREGRTTLVIAHRLSTVRSADRIVVLDEGRAIELGDHAALVACGGAYAELVAHQEGRA
ncbi:MAG: ATP-binding cassette, subfamily bacterial CydD [Solirubrobacteraceae bacterium]|nr:ATP-binding cassette, subfamily bacterial CydD [Solirubrobacteraceae bacterium]